MPANHERVSLRLKNYDYSQAGAYFITICIQARVCLLGDVVADELRLSEAGRMVERWWAELANKYPTVEPDAFIIMPNHIHGIIVISEVGGDLRVAPGAGGGETGQTHRSAPTDARTSSSPDVGGYLRVTPGAGGGETGQTHRSAPTDARTSSSPDVGGDLRVAPGAGGGETGQTHRSAPTSPTLAQIIQWFKTMTTNDYIRRVKQQGWPAFPGKLWQRNYYEHIIRDDADLIRIRTYIANNPLQWSMDEENPIHS